MASGTPNENQLFEGLPSDTHVAGAIAAAKKLQEGEGGTTMTSSSTSAKLLPLQNAETSVDGSGDGTTSVTETETVGRGSGTFNSSLSRPTHAVLRAVSSSAGHRRISSEVGAHTRPRREPGKQQRRRSNPAAGGRGGHPTLQTNRQTVIGVRGGLRRAPRTIDERRRDPLVHLMKFVSPDCPPSCLDILPNSHWGFR